MTPDRIFAVLGNRPRLAIFRRLVAEGPQGMTASEIARAVGQLQQTTTGALKILERAALISGTRRGRSIRYTANPDAL